MADLDKLNPKILTPQGIRRRPKTNRALARLGWAALALLALGLVKGLTGG